MSNGESKHHLLKPDLSGIRSFTSKTSTVVSRGRLPSVTARREITLDEDVLESPRAFTEWGSKSTLPSTFIYPVNPHPLSLIWQQSSVLQKQEPSTKYDYHSGVRLSTRSGVITYHPLDLKRPKSGWRMFLKECWYRKFRV